MSQKKNIDGISTGNLRAARLKFTSGRKYVVGTDGREGVLMFVDAARRTHVHTLSIGCGSEAIFIEPDGQHVLIGVTNEDYVAEVNLESKTVERRITIGKGPDGMAWIGQ
ncbi:MAG: hypothetical protein ICV81_12280 [Flavisolibacter sp.]|nr:hypothetical protein [Flavisolibacter sp.]